MTQNSRLLIFALGLTFSTAAAAQQSLGDAARQARKNKPAESSKKVITNDDIAASKLGTDDSASSVRPNSGAPASVDTAKPAEDKKAALSADDQAKLDKEWQGKITAQKDQISILERELDILQREDKLRAATFYADAGNRLRDEKKYAEQDRKYRDSIAAKQKELDDAKTKLEDMKDEARKSGANVS